MGGVCSAVGSHVAEARAGHHLTPTTLSSGRNIYEELADGFTLLALDAGEDVPRSFQETAAKLRDAAQDRRRHKKRRP